MEVHEVGLASLCGFGGYTGYGRECGFRKWYCSRVQFSLNSWGLSINQRKINTYTETVSLNCILTTISIYFSLPFNILGMTQFGPEHKSEFVDEIQLYGYDGVHKSSEFSRLEFSQIEIKCSHSCLALKFQVSSICCHTQPACDISVGGYHRVRTMWVLGASLIRFFDTCFVAFISHRLIKWLCSSGTRTKTASYKCLPLFQSHSPASWRSAASWFWLHCPWQIIKLETGTLFLSV